MWETWNLNEGSSWDEHLPDQITSEWLSLFEKIFEMSKIDFRRCITPIDSVGDPMLVIFSDASKAAYGAAAYVVWTLSCGSNEARLVLKNSKSFYWCAGEWNIAGLVSRGASPNVLRRNSTWQCGPVFLKQDKNEWPLEQKNYKLSDLAEVASSKVLFNRTSSSTVIVEYDVSKFSSLSALVRLS